MPSLLRRRHHSLRTTRPDRCQRLARHRSPSCVKGGEAGEIETPRCSALAVLEVTFERGGGSGRGHRHEGGCGLDGVWGLERRGGRGEEDEESIHHGSHCEQGRGLTVGQEIRRRWLKGGKGV